MLVEIGSINKKYELETEVVVSFGGFLCLFVKQEPIKIVASGSRKSQKLFTKRKA